jgi:hypothetical protein
MINFDMKLYDFFTIGDNDAYGQPQVSAEPVGKVKMAIYSTSTAIQDNILYKSAEYIGLTTDAEITDRYIIQHNNERLKVLYIQNKGRFKQVFMERMK